MTNLDKYNNKIKHLEFSQIDKYILIGTTICCRAHFEKLIKAGMKADIDLQEEKMDNPSGVTSFLWLPTIDFTPPSQAQLKIGSHFIKDLVSQKMKCYVHCNEGHGRAPTLVAAYYIYSQGLTPRQAVNKIRKRRPAVNPNKKQMKALEIFYKKYKKAKKI